MRGLNVAAINGHTAAPIGSNATLSRSLASWTLKRKNRVSAKAPAAAARVSTTPTPSAPIRLPELDKLTAKAPMATPGASRRPNSSSAASAIP